MTIIETSNAPAAIGPYSQALSTSELVFLSGQLGLIAQSGELAEGLENQTHQAIANITAILDAADMTLDDVVKTSCFLTDISDFGIFNEIYAQYFSSKPARSCVEVSALPKGGLVEIEVIAARPVPQTPISRKS